jgi:hypothetical protein
MGVDIVKEIITGAVYSSEDLGEEYIDNYFEGGAKFGYDVDLIQLNP